VTARRLSNTSNTTDRPSTRVRPHEALDFATPLDRYLETPAGYSLSETKSVRLDWRLEIVAGTDEPRSSRCPLMSLPPTEGPAMEVARQTGELMRARWRDLRAALAATTEVLPWALELGLPQQPGRVLGLADSRYRNHGFPRAL